MVGTGIKSIAVFATLDTNRGDLNGSGPLAIGISCMVALMYSVSLGVIIVVNLIEKDVNCLFLLIRINF